MSNVRIPATVYDEEFYREALDSSDLYLILARMHDSIIKRDDLKDVRAEIKLLIETLLTKRKERK